MKTIDRVQVQVRGLSRPKRWLRACLSAGLLSFGLVACAPMPAVEGPTAILLPGIETPRDRNDIDITIHEIPITAWGKCLGIVAEANPTLAILSVVTLSPMHGCALVPRDDELKPGERPWCVIGVPRGDENLLEHEIRHCEGWDHPRYIQEAQRTIRRGEL